jgi:hypothetical protein
MRSFSPDRSSLIRICLLLVWAAFALILTTQPDSVPLVHIMTTTIGSTDLGGAIGHAGLFGVLTVCGYLVLALRLYPPHALLVAVGIGLILATGTEIVQMNVALRSSSLVDLLANYAGIFAVAFAVSYYYFYRLYPSLAKVNS